MKRKNLLMSLVMFASALTMAGCGESTSSTTPNSSKDNVTSEKTPSTSADKTSTVETKEGIKYQFVGDSTSDTGMAAYGFVYSFYMNLNNDGTIEGGGYSIYSMDTRPAATNEHYVKWFTGKWGASKDDDDSPCLKLSVSYADGVKSVTGAPLSGKFTYIVYEENNAVSNIAQFNVPIALSGRVLPINYNANVYKTADDFIKGTAYQFVEPKEYLAKLEDTTNYQYIYAEADGKAQRFASAIDPADNQRKYYPYGSSTSWSYSDNKLTFNINGEDKDATIGEDGKSITLAWKDTVSYGDSSSETDYSFTCADGSKLLSGETKKDTGSHANYDMYFTYVAFGGKLKLEYNAAVTVWGAALGSSGSYTAVEGDTTNLFDFTCTNIKGADLHVLKNGTYKFSTTLGGYDISKSGTWTFSGFKFVLTETAAEGETPYTVTATIYTAK